MKPTSVTDTTYRQCQDANIGVTEKDGLIAITDNSIYARADEPYFGVSPQIAEEFLAMLLGRSEQLAPAYIPEGCE